RVSKPATRACGASTKKEQHGVHPKPPPCRRSGRTRCWPRSSGAARGAKRAIPGIPPVETAARHDRLRGRARAAPARAQHRAARDGRRAGRAGSRRHRASVVLRFRRIGADRACDPLRAVPRIDHVALARAGSDAVDGRSFRAGHRRAIRAVHPRMIAMFAAIVFAKHLYGGLGRNIFNPAMVGYAVVLIAFPLALARWPSPEPLAAHTLGVGDLLQTIFGGHLPASQGFDTLSQATPLDTVKIEAARGYTLAEIRGDPVFGDFGGKGWEWIADWYALGGFYLLWRRVIHWQVPVALLGTTILLTVPAWIADPDVNPLPLQHVFSGGLMLAAFFIATDPVTGAATPRGRLIFGAGVAALTLAIRRWGTYPDGVAFAVLLMNACVPLLDRITIPRAYGHGRAHDE